MMWSVDDQMIKAPKESGESPLRAGRGNSEKSYIMCVGEKIKSESRER